MSLDVRSITILMNFVNDFLLYMKKNASTLFSILDDGTATLEYHRRVL